MITVYGRPDSSAVARVMWTIGELQLEHTRIDWGGEFGGNDDPAYREKNPSGRIPAVVLEDGTALWESNAIIRYLAHRHPEAGLWPQRAEDRAIADAWMDWSSTFGGPISAIRSEVRAAAPQPAKIAAAKDRAAPVFAILEQRLHGRAHLMGEDFSVADLALGVWGHRWMRLVEGGHTPDLPAISAWQHRLRARPAFQAHVLAYVTRKA